MVASAFTKEDREFLEEIKSFCISVKDANNAILAHFGPQGQFTKALLAIQQLEADHKEMAKNFAAELAHVRRTTFDARGNYRGMFGNEQEARGFGLMWLGLFCGSQKSLDAFKKDFKESHERSQGTIDASAGGALVDPIYSDRIINQMQNYGTFAAKAGQMPMTGPTLNYKKQIGDPVVYLVGEGEAPTASQLTFAQIALQVRKWGALLFYPEELGDDAPVIVGELIGRGIARAEAYHLDRVGFFGTGSLADLRVKGVVSSLRGLNDTIGNIAGIKVGTGNAWSELTKADHLAVIGMLPDWAAMEAEWYCSRQYFFNVMVNIMLSAGGVTAAEIQGKQRLIFNGDPVNLVPVFPRVEANSQVAALYGDLAQTADLGRYKGLAIRRSTEYKFAEGLVTVLGTIRQDVQVHSVGNASANEPEREVGAMAALYTAAA